MRAGGAELLLAEYARVAPGQDVTLSVASLDEGPEGPAAVRLRAAGVEPVHLPVSRLLDPRNVSLVSRWLGDERPDVVHTHLGYADLLGGLAARRLGIPAVSTLHASVFGRGTPRERLKERLMASVRRRCHGSIIAVSEAARESYLETGWDRPDRLVTIPNGIDARPRPGAGTPVRTALGVPPGAPVVGTLSTLRPEKSLETAIEAAALLAGEHPRLRLVIVGEGPERPALEERAGPLGDRVIFAGHREDVMELLDAFDVLVHPSSADALPTALLEAMAASVPVVATRVGGIPEVVEDGVTGRLVDPPPDAQRVAAALAPLLADASLRGRLGAAARERYLAEFTAERWASRMRGVYDQLTAGRRRGPERAPAG
jgi:glycosyltransferase involved in cell wall biosynthesis